jgi:tetratricopeptide (TPR) repeat protein
LLWLLLPLSALAERPIPAYRDELMAGAAAAVAEVGQQKGAEAAEDLAKRWYRSVDEDARIAYEVGLAWRLSGNEDRALTALNQALRLDPEMVAARYDRGEILLARGQLDEAEADFREVARLAPTQWAGHFRLAQLAGLRGEPEAFQAHLLEALRQGFQLRLIGQDPHWSRFLGDSKIGPVLRSLILVYQDEGLLQELERPSGHE